MMNRKYFVLAVISISILAFGAYHFYPGVFLSLFNTYVSNSGTRVTVTIDEDTVTPLFLANTQIVSLPHAAIEVNHEHAIGTADAVASEITGLDGLGAGATFIAGVHIDAVDAVMVTPGTLSINIPEGTDITKLAGFSYNDNGENFHLYPIKVVDGQATFSIGHFSGYGIMLAEPTFQKPSPSGYEARVQQAIMNEILKLQMQQLLGDKEDYGPIKTVVQTELEAWLKVIDSDYATPATNNIAMLEPALLEYIKALQIYQFFGELYGVDLTAQFEEIQQKLEQAIRNANNTAIQTCREQHDPEQAALLLRIFALATLMFPGDFDDIVENARACAQFTLVIETNVTEPDYLNGCPLELNFYGQVPLTSDPNEGFAVTGKGTVSGSISLCDAVCTVKQGSLDQIVNVPSVHINPSNQSKIRFMIEVPESEVPLDWSCKQTFGGGSVAIGDLYEWAYTLLDTELPMLDSEHFVLEDWNIVKDGDTFAEQVYSGKVPGSDPYPIYIDTTYSLKHTPRQ